MRMKQPARTKKAAPLKGSPMKGAPRFTRALGTPAMIVLVFSVIGAAIVIGVSGSAPVQTGTTAARGTERRPVLSADAGSMPVGTTLRDSGMAASDREGAAPSAAAVKPAPVTMTGCLEQDQDSFRLKNAIGDDAPKARSWKSGFLKKGTAPIDVVDASHKLKLPAHVGQRVSVTGVLVGREMQVRSLQRVATTCNQKS
jgi:hypothetical protein